MIIDLENNKIERPKSISIRDIRKSATLQKKQHSSWNLETISLTCRFQWSSSYDIASTTVAYFRCRKPGHLWI
jgi:hypothetical protein